MKKNGANTNRTITSTSTRTTSSSKRAIGKFFICMGLLTLAFAIVVAVIEVFGFLIGTFTSIPVLFKVTLVACYSIALILMFIFLKKKYKFIVLLLWTLTAIVFYLGYSIYQFPQEFINNLYFPKDLAIGYGFASLIAIISNAIAFNWLKPIWVKINWFKCNLLNWFKREK